MSENGEHDSFYDDVVLEENQPSSSTSVKDEPSLRKRSAAVLNVSHDNNRDPSDYKQSSELIDNSKRGRFSISPKRKRSPKKILISPDDANVPGFPSLSGISISSHDSTHLHLLVESSSSCDGTVTLRCRPVENEKENSQEEYCIVYLQGIWSECEVREKSTIRLIAAKKWSNTEWLVDDSSGLVVVDSSVLVPCTSVVQSFFCQRKAVLTERLKGGGRGEVSKAMLMGNIIHELFQAALQTPSTMRLTKEWLLTRWRNTIMDEVVISLTAINFSPNAFEAELQPYVDVIVNWVNSYTPGRSSAQKPIVDGAVVEEVHDIEENIWMPLLGLKGKVDVSLTVRSPLSSIPWLLPLELKTGKSCASADHAGQVLMYTMMLSHRYGLPLHKGSLLYLKDATQREVQPRSSELRAIIRRRNDVASFVGDGVPFETLPPPRADSHFCTRCDYSTACTLSARAFEHGKDYDATTRSDEAFAFQLQLTEHLQQQDVDYFTRWIRWIRMEMGTEKERRGWTVSDIWTVTADERVRHNPHSCMVNLQVKECNETHDGNKFIVTFHYTPSSSNPPPIPFSPGEVVIVSTHSTPAIVMGPVVAVDVKDGSISVLSDRRLPIENVSSKRTRVRGSPSSPSSPSSSIFHLDRHESNASYGIQMNNVIALMSATEKCGRLRSLIIDLNEPKTTKMKSSDVIIVKEIVKGRNAGQVTAVVKSLCASDYALIEGLPGSGKTTTLVSLVLSVVALGRSVLLTAYTHSAVDNLLAKISQHLDSSQLLRLGRRSSVHPSVAHLTLEEKLRCAKDPNEKYDLAKLALASTPVVAASSLSVSTHPLFSWRNFSLCIVDESSLVLESSLLGPLVSADRFVLVGDAKQLSPLVQNKTAREEGMGKSLFERLLDANRERHAVTLNMQYRMNEVLSSIPSELFYSGRLKCANDGVAKACLGNVHAGYKEINADDSQSFSLALSPSLEDSAIFIDTKVADELTDYESCDSSCSIALSSSSPSITNDKEGAIIAQLVDKFITRGISPSSIGVMAAYRKQIDVIRRAGVTSEIEVTTIDQWQGRDKSVVICSLVWTLAHGRKRSELLSDERRINVALTRAKHKLVIVGCARSMKEKCPIVAEVIKRMKVESIPDTH